MKAGEFQVWDVRTACEVTVVPAYILLELSDSTTYVIVAFAEGVFPVLAATVNLRPPALSATVISPAAIVTVITVRAAIPAKLAGAEDVKTIRIAPFLIAFNATSITSVWSKYFAIVLL